MQCNSQNSTRSCLWKHAWKISSNVPTQLLKPSNLGARIMLSHKDKVSWSLNTSEERLQSGFGLLKHERKYTSYKKDGSKLLFPPNLSACSWRIPTSCFARPTQNPWEKTWNPTTVFLVLKLEESFWTENTKPLDFSSCCFSSKLLNRYCCCWQIQAPSPQTHLNTQRIGQNHDSWCSVIPQLCKRRQQEAK